MRAAIGCRDHSGWAVFVAVGGDPAQPQILARERIALVEDRLPRMAYHAALDCEIERAAELVAEVERAAEQGAAASIESIRRRLHDDGHDVVGVAIAAGRTAVPTDLEKILASHSLVHAAEGELYREALVTGAERVSLPVTRFVNKQAISDAAAALGVDAEALSKRLGDLGKPLGPPWQKDHREATAAALIALTH
jgi:hypothetical protein